MATGGSIKGLIDGPVLVLGAGKMGGAILRCWLESSEKTLDLDLSQIYVVDPDPSASMLELLQRYGISCTKDIELKVAPALVLLGIKPQIMDDVLARIGPKLDRDSLIFSIVAGKTIKAGELLLPPNTAFVRAMPNTPVLEQAGMTVMVANAHVSTLQKKLLEHLIGVTGETAWLDDEVLMDSVTAISGSGPAYLFHLAECLSEAGEKEGLSSDFALRLARQTIFGAGVLLNASDELPAVLRENVTSKGGTTAAGLSVLMDDDRLRALIAATVCAARQRSKELGD